MQVDLTPTSYIVLGLLELAGTATPYELKKLVAASVGFFWSVQHAQLYTEPDRLTEAGLLSVERERGGRRRKRYTLTDAGREALAQWREKPSDALIELRDPGLLQLFFGADPGRLARRQLAAHQARLAEYEAMLEAGGDEAPAGPRLALEAGIGHEREYVRFWSRLAEEGYRG